MKAAVIDATKAIAIEDLSLPEVPVGGARVRVTHCGICGSDLDKLLHRQLPAGSVLGHEVAGVIDALSPEAEALYPHLAIDTRVALAHHVPCQTCYYCRHNAPSMCKAFKQSNISPGGFAQYIAVTAGHLAHTIFALPGYVADASGTCIEPLACCLRAIDRIPADAGKTVLLIGLGFIGMLTAQALQEKGYTVIGLELQPERVRLATQSQWVTEATSDPAQAVDMLKAQTEGRGADVVFLTVVTPRTLETALSAVRDGGTLMLFTSYGGGQPILEQNALYFRELTVMTSYSPSLDHLKQAYEWIVADKIQTLPLITHTFSLDTLAEAMETYRQGQAIKVMVTV